jgi:hypothetical protein
MAKYIDSSEATRLKRLKSIKSSIGNHTSHNGWQKQQIEKRRKEQLRQRKEAAKRKPLGGGIQVDTKISKSDAVSKCGLKLKAAFINKTQDREQIKEIVPPKQMKTNKVVAEQTEEGEYKERPGLRSNRRRSSCDPTRRADNESYSAIPGMPSSPSLCTQNNQKKQQKKHQNKENSDGYSMSKDCAAATVDVTVVSAKNKSVASIPTNNKKYFKDIESLKREHADAMKMLEELEVSEGKNRRHSGLSNSEHNSSKASGFSCATDELDHDMGESDDSESREDLDRANGRDKARDEEDNVLTDSFLNMSHLSTSIVPSSSLDGDEEENTNVDGSFTESDFFEDDDADCDPSTFDGEDDDESYGKDDKRSY